jgi:hypothetical protein
MSCSLKETSEAEEGGCHKRIPALIRSRIGLSSKSSNFSVSSILRIRDGIATAGGVCARS